MKMKEIPYFTRSVDRAEKRFADYKARTEAQARNLGFVCAGNLGKGSRTRLNTRQECTPIFGVHPAAAVSENVSAGG